MSDEQPQGHTPVVLPTQKSKPSGVLEEKVVTLYGPPKIGKSTLVSEAEGVLFLECEPGLSELEVFKLPVSSWPEFARIANEVREQALAGTLATPILCIDTIDRLISYAAEWSNKKLGIVHESDAEWGKGWKVVAQEVERRLSRLAVTPGVGLILISHAKEVEIKTPTSAYSRSIPTLGGQIRELVLGMSDVILFATYDEEGNRIIKTKPGREWEAGERGKTPRLPEVIEWPLGAGWEAIRTAWYGKGKVKK